jgi:broad specificity phosphatase PhoE
MSNSEIKKVVYFVRHGQSADNVSPVFQSPDSPLTQMGAMQAERIAERASKLSFETLIASPFCRAKETAEAIAKATQKTIEFSDLFVERLKPTSTISKPYTDIIAHETDLKWKESLINPEIRVEDGENFTDIVERADKALAFLAARSEESMLVVTHGYFMRTMIAHALLASSLTPEAFGLIQAHAEHENTGLTVLRYYCPSDKEPYWKLWIYNDHAHLG